jgi:hypothetical protein
MKNKFNTSLLAFAAALAIGFAGVSGFAQTSAPKAGTPVPPSAPAQAAPPLQLVDNAPARYEVKRGDTLWSIAARFLKSPWRWNEIWRMNKDQIRNPHRIYPGDVLVLHTGADGQPQLAVVNPAVEARPTVRLSPSIRIESIDTAAIPSIPPAIIDPFLTRPLIVGEDRLANSPKIVGGPDTRVVLASGNKIYATGLRESDGANWQVYRPGKALSTPGKKEVLGYEAEYLGDAVVDKHGEVATLIIGKVKSEIVVGDRLVQVPSERIVSYPPHAPDRDLDGRIIALPTTLIESGRDAVVTLDLGKRDGMEIGHVVALYHNPGSIEVIDESKPYRFYPDKRKLALPSERIGLAFVFRVFDRVSYALVLSSTKQVELGDSVRKP